MKARDRNTNEIVEIIRFGSDGSYTVIRNSNGELINLPVSYYDNYEEIIEADDTIDWEQRRYEVAREMLPYAAETSRSILMSGHGLGDDAKGKTFAEVCASSAVSFADALIAELRKQSNPEGKPEKQPDKKEVAIGEVVEYQGEHLLCVEKNDNEDCCGCAFLAEDDDCKFSGYCSKEYRSDGKNVIFVK